MTGIKLTLVVDDAGVPTLVLDTNPTASGGNNDMVHITGDDAGFYDLELTAANLNYVGRAILALTDAANHCPVFHEFMILPAVIYDSLVGGTDLFDVSVTQIAGSAVSTSTAQLGVNAVQAGGTAWGSGAITAGAIASDAITAAKLAADVATEINAGVLAVLGALADASADGDPTITDTAMAYLKQIVDVLVGSAGVVTYPAAAAPGNAVSLAEVLRQVYDEVAGLDGAAMITQANVRSAVGLASANLDTQLDALPTAAENADAVWDEDATGHQAGGTFGQAIGDPAADTNTIYAAVVTGAAGAHIAADIVDIEGKVDDLETRLGTPSDLGSGATVAANLVDIEAQTDDIGAAGAGLTAIPDSAGTTTLLSRLSAARAGYLDNLSAGAVATLAKLQGYVRLLARKDAAVGTDHATELSEINANGGSGAGAYVSTTDSQEALRDRGDAAWATATGFSTLDAAGVRTAVGLAGANLDTQLDAIPTANENADALLKRDWTAVSGEAARSVLNALRALRNRVRISSGTLTVYGEDDATSKWTGAVTTTSGDPVSEIDPS